MEVLMMVIRGDVAWASLMSLAYQPIVRISILDNGQEPATRFWQFRYALDVCRANNIDVVYHRRPELGVAQSRVFLVEQAQHDRLVFSDDDVYWPPDTIAHLSTYLRDNFAWVAPIQLCPNNEAGIPGYVAPNSAAHREFSRGYKTATYAADEANGGAILFKKAKFKPEGLRDWPIGVAFEDRFMVRMMGRGVIHPAVEVWHLFAPGGTNPIRGFDNTKNTLFQLIGGTNEADEGHLSRRVDQD